MEYIELTNQGHYKTMKWENIKSLLGLAKINNRLSSEQVNLLIEKYNREYKWKWLKIVLGIILLIGGIYLASRCSYLITKY